MPRAAATVDIHAPLEIVSGVILELERYPEFLPHVSRVLPRPIGQDTWDVDFHLDFIREIHYTLKVWRETPGRVRWSMVEGVFRSNDGAWEMEELIPGVTTRVRWWVDLQFDLFLPSSLIRTLAQEELPGMLAHFKRRAEAMWTAPAVDVDTPPVTHEPADVSAPEIAIDLDGPGTSQTSMTVEAPEATLSAASATSDPPTSAARASDVGVVEEPMTEAATTIVAKAPLRREPYDAEASATVISTADVSMARASQDLAPADDVLEEPRTEASATMLSTAAGSATVPSKTLLSMDRSSGASATVASSVTPITAEPRTVTSDKDRRAAAVIEEPATMASNTVVSTPDASATVTASPPTHGVPDEPVTVASATVMVPAIDGAATVISAAATADASASAEDARDASAATAALEASEPDAPHPLSTASALDVPEPISAPSLEAPDPRDLAIPTPRGEE